MLPRRELQIDAINSNFDSFESALYMKSVNMPLSTQEHTEQHNFLLERDLRVLTMISYFEFHFFPHM